MKASAWRRITDREEVRLSENGSVCALVSGPDANGRWGWATWRGEHKGGGKARLASKAEAQRAADEDLRFAGVEELG